MTPRKALYPTSAAGEEVCGENRLNRSSSQPPARLFPGPSSPSCLHPSPSLRSEISPFLAHPLSIREVLKIRDIVLCIYVCLYCLEGLVACGHSRKV